LNSILTSCLSITFRMFSSLRYIFIRFQWSASISSNSLDVQNFWRRSRYLSNTSWMNLVGHSVTSY
jgi:hypothetical protein